MTLAESRLYTVPCCLAYVCKHVFVASCLLREIIVFTLILAGDFARLQIPSEATTHCRVDLFFFAISYPHPKKEDFENHLKDVRLSVRTRTRTTEPMSIKHKSRAELLLMFWFVGRLRSKLICCTYTGCSHEIYTILL